MKIEDTRHAQPTKVIGSRVDGRTRVVKLSVARMSEVGWQL